MSSQVYLRLYDLSNGFVKTWSPLILMKRFEGMWHTGVHVFGYEYFYGGGIVKLRSEEVEEQYDMRPIRVDHYGKSNLTQKEFEHHLVSIKDKFHQDYYDLTRWNCNHFSDYVLKLLVGKAAPRDVVNLPSDVEATMIGKLVISALKKWTDGEALVHSDDPMHPKNEMTKRGDKYLLREVKKGGSRKGQSSRQADAIDNAMNDPVMAQQIALSPALRMPRNAMQNRIELIDSGWVGSPTTTHYGDMYIGSPGGIGRPIDGVEPNSPTRLNRSPDFGALSRVPLPSKQISPFRPDGLLPTPPSTKYAGDTRQQTSLKSPLRPPATQPSNHGHIRRRSNQRKHENKEKRKQISCRSCL